ncbi:MAG: diguanylate cyclase [Candidatus Obscuribacterales bacterium]|nr:diguanylate cyclase [Candidatus Obscuribacterales bacterium]
MAEQGRTQLFMMLVQQAGTGALTLSNLTAEQFMPFFRRIEDHVVMHGLSPVIVYWSTRNVRWFLPEAEKFNKLKRDAFCVSTFAEDQLEKQDEFCFLVQSQGISIVVYGRCSDENNGDRIYQCVGSMDPHIVKRAFGFMLPVWQFIDLPESNRLDDARSHIGNPVTAPHFVSGIRNDWTAIKQKLAPGTLNEAASQVVRPGDPSAFPGNAIVDITQGAFPPQVPGMPPPPPIGVSNLPPPPPGSHTLPLPGAPGVVPGGTSFSFGLPTPGASQIPAAAAGGNGKSADNGPAISRPQPVAANAASSAVPVATPPKAPDTAPSDLDNLIDGEPDSSFGDPSLLEEEFSDLQALTKGPDFKPPARSPDRAANGGNGRNGAERKNRGLKDLREVWTNITEEVRSVFAPDAQKIIRDIVHQLRISSDLPAILQLATEELSKLSRADRGLIWQVVDDRLVVTNEFALDGHNCFGGANLGAQESTAIVSEFLSRFPDETGSGVIGIPDTMDDAKLRRMSPTLAALIELGDVRARLVAQIRCRGMFHGFIELQQCKNPRDWSEQDGSVLQSVSEVLSLVVQQSFDLGRIEQDAGEMKLINEISSIFRESGGQRAQYTIEQSIKLLAEHAGFNCAQLFLSHEIDGVLVPQISEKEHSESIPMAHKHNPFLQAFESGKLKTVNLEYSKKADPFFGHDTAMIIPLMSEGERLGVLGLWRRNQGSPSLRPQDRELALTVAGNLASFIRADQAIARIRQDRARASLINTVSEQIQQSLKEVNPILQTLTNQLADHFDLELCAVSIFDHQKEQFADTQCAGVFFEDHQEGSVAIAEHLFVANHANLLGGDISLLRPSDVKEYLSGFEVELPETMQMAMLFPLRQGAELKGALCMVSSKAKPPVLEDMNMIQDLLSRVAVVIAHKELFEQVERQAITDPLTGLYNRRYFEEQLNKEIDRAQRFGHSCSYIILDLDHFKSVNDTLDHGNGDIALKHTSAIVRKCVRDVDTVGRFGGEEFVVLLPESDANAAKVVADRICNSIRESTIEQFKSPACHEKINAKLADGKITEATAQRLSGGKVTASVGVSTFPLDAQDKTHLMELADKFLYVAKNRGRNQVCSSQTAQESDFEAAKEADAKPKEAPSAAAAAPAAGPAAATPSLSSPSAAVAANDLQVIAEHGILGVLGNVIKTVGARDGYNDERSPRAADYATRIALTLRLGKDHCTIISLAAILNNLGKVMIDEQILRKAGPLSADEWKQVEAAPQVAAKILEPAKHLHRVATVVESYQEHWDGSGYPRGIKGEDIPLESRIIAVVDAYVAMTSDRPWRNAMTRQEAIANLQKGAGKDWDPRIVKLFLSILDKENQPQQPPPGKPRS